MDEERVTVGGTWRGDTKAEFFTVLGGAVILVVGRCFHVVRKVGSIAGIGESVWKDLGVHGTMANEGNMYSWGGCSLQGERLGLWDGRPLINCFGGFFQEEFGEI
jgi:hypothetical protein